VGRDLKIALIVGFSLLLLVWVLISDHFSRAQSSRLAAVPDEGVLAAVQPEAPLRDTRRSEPIPSRPIESGSSLQMPLSDALRGGDDRLADSSQSKPALIIDQGTRQSDGVMSDVSRAVTDFGRRVANGELSAPVAAKTSEPVIGGRVQWHSVRENETLFGICARYYGDGHLWPKLAAYNEGRVGANGFIRQGVRLKIPDALELTGVGVSPAKRTERASKPAPERAKKASSGARTYTVKKGDTLGEIAQKQLGTVKRMDEIMTLNSGTLRDANDLRVGMVLKIPAR